MLSSSFGNAGPTSAASAEASPTPSEGWRCDERSLLLPCPECNHYEHTLPAHAPIFCQFSPLCIRIFLHGSKKATLLPDTLMLTTIGSAASNRHKTLRWLNQARLSLLPQPTHEYFTFDRHKPGVSEESGQSSGGLAASSSGMLLLPRAAVTVGHSQEGSSP